MAESSIDHASRFKKKNNYERERHREQNSSSRHDNYYNEADNRGSSSAGGLKDFSRDHKPNPNDRSHRTIYDRRHPRSPKHDRVNHKSEEMRYRTSPHSSRYDEHRNSSRNVSSRVDRFTDRSFGSENRENVSSANRIEKHHERNLYANDTECISSLSDKVNHLSSQVELLTQENEKLRYSLNGSNYRLQDPNSDVNITFKDKYLERKFLPTLEELVFQLMIGNVSIEEIQQLYCKGDLPEEGKISPCLPEGDLFAVDSSTVKPSDEFANVPRYDSSFSEVLQNEEAVTENKAKPPKFQSSCFNCGGNHVIRDCPQRIDYQKVAFAKKSFKAQAPKGRYHCLNNVESVFKPGVISKELRRAMDLGPDQVPSYIYHMRLLDYPPGWLQEATVESSGIALYGIDEKTQRADSEEMEQKDGAQVLYDPSKFIDYPGFNIPLPPNIKDECDELGMPPMQPHHLRSFVEQNITTKVQVLCPKRKRKLSEFDNKPAKVQRVEEDMEIASDDSDAGSVEFIPPLPTEDPPPPPPEILILSDAEDSNSGTDTPLSDTLRETLAQRLKKGDDEDLCSAPSLRDLEEIKKQLVQELGMASGSSSPLVLLEDSTDGTSEALHNDTSRLSDSSSASGPRTLQRSESQCSKSKLVMLGTPSLSRHSSYQKLPQFEKFSKDVTSHLNFENLPNSTGAYQKMKTILKKVKSKISSMV